MEIILESDLPVGLSSYSLMRRREFKDESSYLGDKYSYYDNTNKKALNGAYGDGYFCNNSKTSTKCSKKECKEIKDKSVNVDSIKQLFNFNRRSRESHRMSSDEIKFRFKFHRYN